MAIFTGTSGSDAISGTSGADTISGLEGDDSLRGRGGNDTIDGGDGDDFINGGFGDDIIDGGTGYDRAAYFVSDPTLGGITVSLLLQGSAQYVGSQGWDTLFNIENVSGTPFADTITGDGGDNWLWGSTSWLSATDQSATNNDAIDGGDGNDLIEVGFGNHILAGGNGTDTLLYSENGGTEVGVIVSLALQGGSQDTGAGSWTISGFENLAGGTQADTLIGDGNANILAGGDGGDLLIGGGGNDSLYGDGYYGITGTGSGTYFLGTDADVANGAVGGNDTLEGGLGNDLINGGVGVDTASYANASGAVTVNLFANGGGNGSSSGADGNDTLVSIENITGSAYNDTLTGNSLDNVLTGGDGHDTLRGNLGNDVLVGGTGDDFLSGGMGDDLLDGGAGFDRVSYLAGAFTGIVVDLNIQGVAQNTVGAGMDTLIGIEHVSGTIYNDVLTGNGGDNWLWGGSDGSGVTGNDVIDAGAGNDLVEVGTGNHTLTGGSGNDTVSLLGNTTDITSDGVTFSLALQGAAQDTEQGMMNAIGFENVSGSIYADNITGDDGDNVLAGDVGADVLVGGAGNDALYGDGRVFVDTHGVGGSGPITTFADIGLLDPSAVDGNDILEGGLGDDLLNGGGGADTASYANATGAVTVVFNTAGGTASGADGNDTLVSIENVTGSAFNDTIIGNSGDNVLTGGDGHDFLRGLAGNDVLVGGNGDDYLDGGQGNDILDGGAGFDRVSYFGSATGPVTIDLRLQGAAQDTGQGMDTLIGIEHFGGTTFGDTLIGDDGDNWIRGSTDGGAADTIDGQGGNDLIEDAAGNHVLAGGAGIDTFLYLPTATTIGINVSLALQGAAQDTGVGLMTLTGFENLSASRYADTLTGDGNANVLAGGDGNDTLVGAAGNDALYGDGNVSIDTHGTNLSGPIVLETDANVANGAVGGNDILEGGLGDDLLNGGIGIDTASYANASGAVTVDLGSGTSSGADGSDTLVSIENIVGSAFADMLIGNGGANAIDGLGGNDFIAGGAGNDVIVGGDGDDFLQGDFGDNNLAAVGNDAVYGGNGNDQLRGGAGNDMLYGGSGNDLMRGNSGVDYFDGGADDGVGVFGIGDRVGFYEQRATQGVVADLRTGIISNDGYGNVETMVDIESLGSGTAYADTFYGNDGRNYLAGDRGDIVYGFGGDDLFQMTSAAAVLDGGLGRDHLYVYSSGGWLTPDSNGDGIAEVAAAAANGWNVNLAAGTVIDGYGNSGTVAGIEDVDGSELGDTLVGDAGGNVLSGMDGNDVIAGGLGNDTIDGGTGIDTASYANAVGGVSVDLNAGTATGADGSDTLVSIENVTGSASNDIIIGNAGANILTGGAGHDALRGNDGDDSLSGGDGDDFLNGGAGNDILNGGNGTDRVAYAAGATGGVTVNLNLQGVAQNTGSAGMDTLIAIEQVSGTMFNDTLVGDGANNWLWGGSNGSGVTGNDNINAGAGNDLVEVGTGNHVLNGGIGNDTLSLWGNSTDITAAGINISLLLQGTTQNTQQGLMNVSGFENVSGSRYNDVITGDAGANILLGDTGNDTLNGGDGNDTLYGDGRMGIDSHGAGTAGPITLYGDVERDIDSLTGLDGNDIINAGKGNDVIYGGRGNDIMSGGPGSDQFMIEARSGNDHITDFAHVDKIVFDALSGADDYSDLIFALVGKDTLITWGTGDSLTIDGLRPRELTSADFVFAPATATSATASLASVEPSFHSTDFAASHAGAELAGHALMLG